MKPYVSLQKLKSGDSVAIISPSAGLPGLFPWVQDFGVRRLESVFGLVAVEYPTTRQMNSSPEDRAADIMSAFSDQNIKAIITSIGGNDQIKVLKYLDEEIILRNPKPFFGFSDNTHLHIYLSNLGIPSYYGGAIMTQFALQQGMQSLTVESLKRALFEGGEMRVSGAQEYNDVGIDWADKSSLKKLRIFEPNDGLIWSGVQSAEGLLWGGCVESMIAQVAAGIHMPSASDMKGRILFLETAEDIPPHWVIKYLLIGLGERGWFDDCVSGIMIGRPKAWDFSQQNDIEWKKAYREEQRTAVIDAVRAYSPNIPIVQNVDFGHTEPQVVLPIGRSAKLFPDTGEIVLNYS